MHIQGFDANAIAHEVEGILARIVDGDGEHAVQTLQAGNAFALVQAQDHLGVRAGVQAHALGAQFGRQFDVVEDLAVLHDGDLSVIGHERLVAAADVDDGQAPVADRDTALGHLPNTFIVRPTVHQAAGHGRKRGLGQGLPVAMPVAEDAAHISCSRDQ